MKKSCMAITWDGTGTVIGVRAEKDGKNGPTSAAAVTTVAEGEFSVRLTSAARALMSGEHDYVVLGGVIPGEVVFDLKMPRLTPTAIPPALEFELPCLLPRSADGFRRSFRVVNRTQDDATESVIRVMLTPTREWERLLGDIDAAGVKVDAVVNPFFTVDPLLADRDLFCPDLDEDSVFSRAQGDGLRHMSEVVREAQPQAVDPEKLVRVSEAAAPSVRGREAFVPALLLARYALDGHLQADRKGLLPLPPQLRPQRCVIWRRLAAAMITVTLLLLGLLAGRNWYDARQRYEKVIAAQTRINALLAKQQRQIQKNLLLEKSINKIIEAKPGNAEIPVLLAHLTRKLPEKMWITGFRSKGQSVDLTISARDDNDNLLGLLSEGGVFMAKNLRKQRSFDGSTIFQLFLEASLPPGARR